MDVLLKIASDNTNKRCDASLEPGYYLNLTLSIFILIAILLSYLPQHYRIIARGTSEGLSPYFILLGATSGTCAFANILVSPVSRADVACCKVVSIFDCATGLLGIVQVGMQWFCFTVILFLFLIFFPRFPVVEDNEAGPSYTWRTALTIGFICLFHGLITIVLSAALAIAKPSILGTWGNILGVIATTLAAIQYIPQIWTTWYLGHVGSLSIPMMLIQTPGSFVWAASLAARMGIEGWSTWGLLIVTGCLQGCLLAMAICFEIKARRGKNGDGEEPSKARCVVGYISSQRDGAETDDEGGAVVETPSSERTPLLNGSRKSSRAYIRDTN
ncbi:hypothetical protein BJ875DRAFT_58319 [Amylocarpus encephaloides]|uniref:PQ loop repeat protein n=1 Tax=Amylocarpus encephaloides TaxID=45428 RepID=A0A9P7YG71_9HELO|nr:hypothetical protein BJ875DRAFT_58319 [Amylocarpus encephaloides]